MQVDPDTQRKIAALTRDLETTQQRLADLEEAHQGRAQTLAEERAEQERQAQKQERFERMTSKELAAEIRRLTPRPVEEVLGQHPEIVMARFEAMQRHREARHAQTVAYRAQLEAAQWCDAHPHRARLHSLGVSQPYLAEREQIQREQTQRGQALSLERDRAEQQSRQIADRLRPTVIAEQQQAQAWLAELEKLRQAKVAQEQAQERQAALESQKRRRPALAERSQVAQTRQVESEPQERPQAAQKPLQTAIECLQAAQPRQVGSRAAGTPAARPRTPTGGPGAPGTSPNRPRAGKSAAAPRSV